MNTVCLHVTWRCNWDCDYCITDTHNKPKLGESELWSKISQVPWGSDVSLTGGEPGLVPLKKWNIIIPYLKKHCNSVNMNTNGLFLQKYWNELYHDIDHFVYHCSQDMEEPIQYYPPDPRGKIEYSVIITSRNKDNLPGFMRSVTPKKIPITFVADKSLDYADRLRIFKQYKYSNTESLLSLLEGVTHNDILKL